MAEKQETLLQTPKYYADRYIQSWCMEWRECTYIRSDGTKAGAWKKPVNGRVHINLQSWALELARADSTDIMSRPKSQIHSVTLEEIKDAENRTTPYILLLVGDKKEPLSISLHQPTQSEMFFFGLCILTDQPLERPAYHAKVEEFKNVIAKTQEFLKTSDQSNPPPIPPQPANLNFCTQI